MTDASSLAPEPSRRRRGRDRAAPAAEDDARARPPGSGGDEARAAGAPAASGPPAMSRRARRREAEALREAGAPEEVEALAGSGAFGTEGVPLRPWWAANGEAMPTPARGVSVPGADAGSPTPGGGIPAAFLRPEIPPHPVDPSWITRTPSAGLSLNLPASLVEAEAAREPSPVNPWPSQVRPAVPPSAPAMRRRRNGAQRTSDVASARGPDDARDGQATDIAPSAEEIVLPRDIVLPAEPSPASMPAHRRPSAGHAGAPVLGGGPALPEPELPGPVLPGVEGLTESDLLLVPAPQGRPAVAGRPRRRLGASPARFPAPGDEGEPAELAEARPRPVADTLRAPTVSGRAKAPLGEPGLLSGTAPASGSGAADLEPEKAGRADHLVSTRPDAVAELRRPARGGTQVLMDPEPTEGRARARPPLRSVSAEPDRDDELTRVIEPVGRPPRTTAADESVVASTSRRSGSGQRPRRGQPRGPEGGSSGAVSATTTSRAGRNLPAAIGVGLTLGAAVIASLLVRKEAFVVIVAAAILTALWELARALRQKRIAVPLVPLSVGALGMLVSAFVAGEDGLLVSFALTAFGVLLWRLIDGHQGAARDVAASVFVAAYVPFLAGFALLLLATADGAYRVLVFMAVTVANDIGGYASGVLLGRHPIAPAISPKKSWEGLGGSFALCMIVGAGTVYYLLHGSVLAGLALGAAAALTATIGDLSESLIKRDLGIKDMGNLLPGHGGIMDRLDSLLPTAPVAFLLLSVLVPVTVVIR